MPQAATVEYQAKKEEAASALRALGPANSPEAARSGCPARSRGEIALSKRNSNLFRQVGHRPAKRLDLSRFDQVIRIDQETLEAEVEGRITYEALVSETLRFGLVPAVVPQLKSITVGGAISGGGIESSSFRYGFVHETVREMDLLLASGDVVTCNPENEHRQLFYGVANSYGTLGYILRARIRLVRAAPFVELKHLRFDTAAACFAAMEKASLRDQPDFVDGAVFSPSEHYLTVGRWAEDAPYASDYRFMRIYYQSIRRRPVDYLRAADYIWRWDTDWFWCARAFGMELKPLRFVFGSLGLLRSTTYWKIRDMALRSGLAAKLEKRSPCEHVIQDVEIPIARAAEFLAFLHREIGLRPIWLCPAKAPDRAARHVLYLTDPDVLYVNFGFWGTVPSNRPPGHYNRLIEKKVVELDGKKSLYSSSYFSEEEFWRIYNRPAYDRLKEQYDPGHRLRDLYQKCVLNGKG